MGRDRKKKGRPISGWLILDKPYEMGSTQAVSKIKWLFGAQKAGHAGTLDPLASGILPIALGEATKTVPYVMDGTKVYRFTVAWGAQTSTDDLEGEVVSSSDKRPSADEVSAIVPNYTGVIEQVPPQFSAVRVDGDRAYDIARKGNNVEIAARQVEIDAMEVVSHSVDETVFEATCGKGTYVRALARDMGKDLGCFGHITKLRRTVVEPFDEEDAVTLDELIAARGENNDEPAFEALDELLLDTGEAMADYPRIELSDDQASRIRLGNPAIVRGRDAPIEEPEACAFHKNRLLAIGEIARGAFAPRRVFKI